MTENPAPTTTGSTWTVRRATSAYHLGDVVATGPRVGIVTRTWSGYTEDGPSFGMGFEEGRIFWAQVRLATRDEAPTEYAVMEAEYRAEHLERRQPALFQFRAQNLAGENLLPPDATKPQRIDIATLDDLPKYVTVAPPSLKYHTADGDPRYNDHIRADRAASVAYTLRNLLHGGIISQVEANDTTRNWEVIAYPITEARNQWLHDAEGYLRAGDPAFMSLGIGPASAELLRAAGWSTWDVTCARKAFRVDDETAGQAVAHPPAWWQQRQWWDRAGWSGCSPRPDLITPNEAAELAEQGITGFEECERRRHLMIAAGNTGERS